MLGLKLPVPGLNKLEWIGIGAILLAVVGGCLYLAWLVWGPSPAKPAVYSQAVQVAPGSLMLETKPQADAKPKTAIPKGAKVVSLASVTVNPFKTQGIPVTAFSRYTGAGIKVSHEPSPSPCPPVTVDLSLIRMPDESRRVVASSPDGEVVGGVDIPVEAAKPEKAQPKWAVGAGMNPVRKTAGIAVQRDLGFIRIGVDLRQRDVGDLPTEPFLWGMVRF